MAQTNLDLGSACVPHALVNVPFTSRTTRGKPFDASAHIANVRRETRRTAPGTGALPET
ncbi:MAG: hypothetical protein WAO21_06325 [Verrucomicrobiia bacterium]